MLEYIKQPVFWISVIIVALVANWVWMKFFSGKGKLV